jgi:hypothetical protein
MVTLERFELPTCPDRVEKDSYREVAELRHIDCRICCGFIDSSALDLLHGGNREQLFAKKKRTSRCGK